MASGARDRKMSSPAAELPSYFGDSAREGEAKIPTLRSAIPPRSDVHPANAARPARADSLHERLLRCKTDRELRPDAAQGATVGDLGAREDSSLEALAASGEKALDARDLDHVDPTADDHTPSLQIPPQGSRTPPSMAAPAGPLYPPFF